VGQHPGATGDAVPPAEALIKKELHIAIARLPGDSVGTDDKGFFASIPVEDQHE
jgi:hypothetical protein